jgi:hypothetical protein
MQGRPQECGLLFCCRLSYARYTTPEGMLPAISGILHSAEHSLPAPGSWFTPTVKKPEMPAGEGQAFLQTFPFFYSLIGKSLPIPPSV